MAGGRPPGSSTINEDEIYELVSRLEAVLPELSELYRKSTTRESASGVLKETSRYIKRLRREVDTLSLRLSGVLETMDPESAEAKIIRNLFS